MQIWRGLAKTAALTGTAAALIAATVPGARGPGWVDDARIATADADHDNWLGYGRTWDEQRYSPLDQINAGDVNRLRLAWAADLDTIRGQEATPIVVDGVLYTSTAWSKVMGL
ncbi:MAG: hypothetical protein PGN09_07105 [Sphingomonas fennica]